MPTFSIASGANDGFVAEAPVPSLDTTEAFVQVGDAVDSPFHGVWRFTGVTIANGAEIVSAYLRITPDDNYSVAGLELDFYGFAADNATFPSDATDYNSRTLTSAVVGNFPALTTDVAANSPNLAAIIQAIVDRAGWASGNALVLTVKGADATDNTLRAWSYNGSAAKAAQLIVNLATAGGTGSARCNRRLLPQL
jgi:hypothetical protein